MHSQGLRVRVRGSARDQVSPPMPIGFAAGGRRTTARAGVVLRAAFSSLFQPGWGGGEMGQRRARAGASLRVRARRLCARSAVAGLSWLSGCLVGAPMLNAVLLCVGFGGEPDCFATNKNVMVSKRCHFSTFCFLFFRVSTCMRAPCAPFSVAPKSLEAASNPQPRSTRWCVHPRPSSGAATRMLACCTAPPCPADFKRGKINNSSGIEHGVLGSGNGLRKQSSVCAQL